MSEPKNKRGRPRLDPTGQSYCVRFSIALTQDLHEDVERCRLEVDMNRSEFVREALERYIKEVTKE